MPRVIVADQQKRWGSCNHRGTIRLNWRIIQAPMRLIDYVVVHELVHLLHRGHGRDYWQAVGRVMPDYERRREELRQCGTGLGDVLRSLSKKKMYGSPNSNPSPELGGRQGEPHIMGKVLPSQRLLKQFEERLVFGDMNLSEIVRSGAQMMLQYALEREVTEALGRGYYENAPETTKEKGRRNGYESHRVLTGEGAVTVQVPQIRETSTGFRSKILDAYVSRTEKTG